MKGITLIGMPGSGKSTIGKKLAERLKFRFVDLDELIKEKIGRSHAEILEKDGRDALINLENQLTLELNFENTIFSPGGSIIYSLVAMEKLRAETTVIYLELPLQEIQKRLGKNPNSRGIVGLQENGLDNLYRERTPLYQKFALHTVSCFNTSDQQIIESILVFLRTLE
ncbi:MAG: shikimate kinase [Patescibacteria group bacterium]